MSLFDHPIPRPERAFYLNRSTQSSSGPGTIVAYSFGLAVASSVRQTSGLRRLLASGAGLRAATANVEFLWPTAGD